VAQDEIGWGAMMLGNISIHWREIQHGAILPRSGPKILKPALDQYHMIIQKLWQVAWDEWDHRNEVLHKRENSAPLTEA
jgi:hypothetical protein